jgi:hypothetical protein
VDIRMKIKLERRRYWVGYSEKIHNYHPHGYTVIECPI